MRYLILLAIIGCIFFSCKTIQRNNFERREKKEIYVDEFKMTYFKKMLLAGFRNSNEIRSVLYKDISGFGEIILTMDDYIFIDSIVAYDHAKMIKDSTNSIGRQAEGAAGKKIFHVALTRYNSKWLDHVAKKRSKSYTHPHRYVNEKKYE